MKENCEDFQKNESCEPDNSAGRESRRTEKVKSK
jgi:hypothetical protein